MFQTSQPSHSPVLDEAHAGFIQRNVAINVASRDAGNVPTLTRALGCRVSPDRRQITLFLSVARSEALLENIRNNGAVAVVFSQPTTHRTIQLKGIDAHIVPIEDGDRAVMADCRESFVEELRAMGYTESLARAILPGTVADLVGVSFTPTAAFQQTPGPGAGQQLQKQVCP